MGLIEAIADRKAEGAKGLSPGFQPWKPENKRLALKGERVSGESRTYDSVKVRVRN
jgi:hypothetical protein